MVRPSQRRTSAADGSRILRFPFRADVPSPPEAEIPVPEGGFRDYHLAYAACREWALRLGRPHLAFWACEGLIREQDRYFSGSGTALQDQIEAEILGRVSSAGTADDDPPPF